MINHNYKASKIASIVGPWNMLSFGCWSLACDGEVSTIKTPWSTSLNKTKPCLSKFCMAVLFQQLTKPASSSLNQREFQSCSF